MTMNKTEIFEAFDGLISKTAIKNGGTSGEPDWYVEGKWARISPVEFGKWDVWVHNKADLAAGLTEHRVSAILKKVDTIVDRDVRVVRYDGEAAMTLNTDEVLRCTRALGIRRTRVVSEQTKEALLAQLEAGRLVLQATSP